MNTNRDDLLILFRRLATEVVEKDFTAVCGTSGITDLGIDSLGMLEIIGSMERELKIRIADDTLQGVVTVNDLLDVVYQHIETKLPT